MQPDEVIDKLYHIMLYLKYDRCKSNRKHLKDETI